MTSSTPNFPQVVGSKLGSFIKPATVDLILDNEALPVELITNIVFEEIGGQELINIVRNDIINGQDVLYQTISNLSRVALQYNSKNLVPIAGTADQYFKNFQIDLESKTLDSSDGEFVYIDSTTGDLVINLKNIADDEDVEIQVISSATSFDGTIY